MKRLALLVSVAAANLAAHDIITTKIMFSREVSRILYKRCVSCHHDGGAAFSLVTYEQARPWAKAIKEEVLSRRMPPWGAVKGFGEIRDDRALPQEDLEILATWVEGGAPEGDPRLLPKVPVFSRVHPTPHPAGTIEIPLDRAVTLKHPATLEAIRPKELPEGASVKVVVERRDGSLEPLVWIDAYRAAYNRTYIFVAPLHLPPGTRIVMSPSIRGSFTLFAVRDKNGE